MRWDEIKMTKALTLLMTLFLCSAAFADDTRHVLIVHSFHQGREWSDHITQGIQSVFEPFEQDIQLHFEYMDSLRCTSDACDAALAALTHAKLEATRFDVVIASGLPALRFTRRHAIKPATGSPVVFCGVAHFPTMVPDHPEIGVVADVDHQATLKLMLALHPHCRRIVVIADAPFFHNAAGEALEQSLTAVRQQVLVSVWPVTDPGGLPARLVGLDAQDLVYLPAGAPQAVAEAQSAADIEQLVVRWSPVPIYSSIDHAFGKGIVGGMITSGVSQGEHAARLALRILSGQSVNQVPAVLDDPNQYMFDGQVLRRFQIKASQLPAGSRIIHLPPPPWARYAFVLAALAAAVALVSIVLMLQLLRQKKRQRILTRANAELDGRFREKSAHLQLVNQKLKKQALIDDLTGLPNRRYVYQRFVEEAKKARRYHLPLALLLINVDGFKDINDKHGYVVAERVLRDVGQAVRRNIREIDLIGRYGGESFLVILPNTDQGNSAADRIRKTVLSLQWEQGEQRVTLSGGLAQLGDQTPAELIALAEKHLDLARSQGGNSIVDRGAGDVADLMKRVSPKSCRC